MMGFWILIVALLSGLCQSQVEAAKSANRFDITDIDGSLLTYTYDLLDRYLAPIVDKNDLIGSAQKIVSSLYDKNLEKGFQPEDYHMRSQRLFQALYEAANNDDVRCTALSGQILRQNDLATRKKSRSGNDLKPLNQIVYQLTQKHFNLCKDVYPDKYLAISESLDSNLVANVEKMIETVVESESQEQTESNEQIGSQRFFDFAQAQEEKKGEYRYSVLDSESMDKTLYDVVSMLAQNDPEKQYLQKVASLLNMRPQINKKKFGVLVSKYLLDPCKVFVQKMRDVYIPAKFDAEWKPEQIDGTKVYFYRGWAAYEFCTVVNAESRKINNKLLMYANQIPFSIK